MKKIALLGALALSLLSPLTMAQEAKALRIGIEAAYPPFAYKTPDGNITGFDYDIGVALCEDCLLYTSPSPRDRQKSRMPSSA